MIQVREAPWAWVFEPTWVARGDAAGFCMLVPKRPDPGEKHECARGVCERIAERKQRRRAGVAETTSVSRFGLTA